MDNERIAYLELFGIRMSGVRAPEGGLYWTDLEGWWGLPDLKTESDSIPGTHGRFTRAYYYRDSRVITLTGHILTDTPNELAEVRARLESALMDGYGEMTVVTDSYGIWSREVEVDTLEIEPDHGKTFTKFTIDMIAPDPFRYAPEVTSESIGIPWREGGLILPKAFPWNFGNTYTARLTIENTGGVPMYPTITVTGAADAITIYGGGNRISLPAFSGTILVNTLDRRVWLDGSDVTRNLIRREWPVIPPHSRAVFYFVATNPSPETQMTVTYRIGEP